MLTATQKQQLLQSNGYDPSIYDMDEEGNVFTQVKSSPAVNVNDVLTKPEAQSPIVQAPSGDTALTTGIKSFASAAPSAIAGGVGAGLLTAESVPLAHIAPPWSEIIAGGIGAIGGGLAASKLQKMVEPEAWQQNVAESQATNPIAATLGNLATLPLGGFNPSPTSTIKGVGTLGKLVVGMEASEPEISNLINVGLGAGVGAGTGAAQDVLQGRMPDIKSLLEGAATGAVFNKPNAIGRALGFHAVEPNDPLVLAKVAQLSGEPLSNLDVSTKPNEVTPEPDVISAGGLPFNKGVKETPLGPKARTAMPEVEVGTKPPSKKFYLVSRENPDFATFEGEGGRFIPEREVTQLPVQNPSELLPVKRTMETLPARYDEQGNRRVQEERNDVTTEQPNKLDRTDFEKQMMDKIRAANIPEKPSNNLFDLLNGWFSNKRGVSLVKNPDLKGAGDTMVPSDAKSSVLGYLAHINPNKATVDTLFHEPFHVFYNRLKYSDRPSDQRLINKFENLVKQTPEYQRVFKDYPNGVEEYITSNQGWEAVRRHILQDEGGLKSYFKDMLSYIKTRYGSNASEADFRRVLDYKFANDPTWTKYHGDGLSGTDFRQQEERNPKMNSLEDDIQRYREITDRMSTLMKDGSFGDEFSRLFTELEQVKNRHGGMPPTSKRQQETRQAQPEHEDVRNLIANAAKGTDDATISEQNANEITKVLREQVDWSKIPKVKQILDNPQFDSLDPDNWATIQDVYNHEVSKKEIAPELPKKEVTTKVEPTKKETFDDVNLKISTQNVGKASNKENGYKPSFESVSEMIGHNPEKTTGQRERELFDAKQRWKQVEDTENPKETMNLLADRWRKNENPNRRQEMLAQMQYLTDKYGVAKPELEGIRRQEERVPYKKASFAPFLTSRIDKIAERFKDNPLAQYATQQLHKFSGESDYLTGQIANKLIAAVRGNSKESVERVYRYLHQVDDKGSSLIRLSPSEKTLADKITEIVREPRNMQIGMGLKVKAGPDNYRVAGIKPGGYMFNMIDPQVVHTWLEKPSSPEARAFDKAYIDHQISHGVSPEEAKNLLTDYKGAIGNNATKDTEFGAIRKAEGNGLPWELVDKNFASASERYGRRAARDLAFFKYIQSDPKMQKALNIRDQFGVRPEEPDAISSSNEVKDALRSVFGIDIPQNPKLMAGARVIGNMIMGPGTAARNILNIPSFVSNYVQVKQLPLVFKALSNINESRVRAFQSNAVKAQFQDFDAAGYYAGNPDPMIRLFDKFSQFSRKFQGRDFSDKFEGEYFYSLGELLATSNIAAAKNGDKESTKWLQRFGDIVDGGTDKLIKGEVTQDDISRVAKRFVDTTRGTYGEEGLPGWAIEGSISPFAALSRFSIEKSNTIYKDVINPLKEGNVKPLLAYTLTSLGVGYGTEKLNELLSNKRGNDPTVAEAMASQKPEELFAKAVGLLQLSTFAGVVGDGAKLAVNAALGKSVTRQNTLSFPLYDFVTNTVGSNIAEAAQAIQQGEDPFQVMAKLAQVISTSSVQSARYVNNNFIEPADTKRKERFRDLATYETMMGYKQPGDINPSNEFQNLGYKEFKKTDDISQAASDLPDLINHAISKSTGDNGIDIEKLRSELSKIKQNNYSTMPSPEDMPRRFLEYLNYLRTTQGEEAAQNRLVDYIKQNAINQTKSSLVPAV